MTGLEIHPLGPEHLDDFLRFMEGPAFADHPAWRSCYCQYPQVDHRVVRWADRTAEQNRAAACARIGDGRMQGLLARRGGEVVGWCNAAPQRTMAAFDAMDDPDADTTALVTCFVVAAPHRRSGIARALLDAACDRLAAAGLRRLDARPSRRAVSDAELHTGPLALYLSAGFSVVHEEADGTVHVRRTFA